MQLSKPLLRRQAGISLIEVLIAVVLLSGGVLTMAALHANSLKYSKMAQFRGIATQLAFDLSDRMRANTAAAVTGAYTLTEDYDADADAMSISACATPTACTTAEIAAIDVAEMFNTAQLALPGGSLRIEQDATEATIVNIWIVWLDPEAHGGDANDTSAMLACPFAADPQPQCLPMRVAL